MKPCRPPDPAHTDDDVNLSPQNKKAMLRHSEHRLRLFYCPRFVTVSKGRPFIMRLPGLARIAVSSPNPDQSDKMARCKLLCLNSHYEPRPLQECRLLRDCRNCSSACARCTVFYCRAEENTSGNGCGSVGIFFAGGLARH